jgi:YfiH family protein
MSAADADDFALRTWADGWTVGRFAPLDGLGWVVHAVTTRAGPDPARVLRDGASAAADVAAALGLRGAAFLDQVHGCDIRCVRGGGLAGTGDGLITDVPGVGLMGRSADCPLILAADRARRAVGVAHASWRATVGGIAPRLIRSLQQHFNTRPQDVVACICPSAGPCCYRVGRDVADAADRGIGPHARAFLHARDGETFFDLWAANADQLRRAGVAREDVHVAGICTICRNDLFPSYRVEGDAAGRFLAVIAAEAH